ncbi:helix-turn-helix transcriptional regulator [Terrarubrum flagellatum]|uniref:AraC family transcriptional regulator n=1 Tax=Terrirubrum flagellatum TaxID=2895980 RepID=UPI003144FA02
MAKPSPFAIDKTDRPDGPAIIAQRGSDDPAAEFRLGTRETRWHSHLRGQLIWIESGLLTIRTPDGSWTLPPHRACWVPPRMRHRGGMSGALAGWSAHVLPAACRDLPDRARVIGVSELMRALVRRAAGWAERDALSVDEARMADVLISEIRCAPIEPLHLPMPTDPRLVRIATEASRKLADQRSLEEWAAWGGVSPRTLRRLFRAETGTSFAQWRTQARLLRAMEMLAGGAQVAIVADAVGYASPSNFIAVFKRSFGAPPARYFAARGATAANVSARTIG